VEGELVGGIEAQGERAKRDRPFVVRGFAETHILARERTKSRRCVMRDSVRQGRGFSA